MANKQEGDNAGENKNARGGNAEANDAWGQALRLADEEREWRQLIKHLPENARQIWQALNDMREFWRVLHAFGGQSIRIPRTLPKKRTHQLRKVVGLGGLRKLVAAFGGTSIYIPRCNALKTRLRHHDIIKDFTRRTAHGSSSTSAVATLARRHGISDRRIWQILKKEASVPAQARVLLRLGDSAQISTSKMDNQP